MPAKNQRAEWRAVAQAKNQRLFGEVGLTDDPDAFIARSDLGPDALVLAAGPEAFAERFGHRRGQIKSALMDQSLLAGIGNVYSDEILYRARMHPRARVDGLDRETLRELAGCTQRVLEAAIDMGAGSQALFEHLPDDWLLAHRKKGANCPRCGGEIATVNAAGRKSYYCPRCQPS